MTDGKKHHGNYHHHLVLVKLLLLKKFSRNTNLSRYQYHIQRDHFRTNEVDGVDYHFVSTKEKFTNLIRMVKNFMSTLKYLITIMEHLKKMLMKQ